MSKVQVHAYCGFYVWRDTLSMYDEPYECTWEDIIEVDKEDWKYGFLTHKCPRCNAELTQDMDHFDLL